MRVMPISFPLSCFVAWLPSVAITFGRISSTWRKRYGSHASFSSGTGSRLPGGRHLSTLQTNTCERSRPIPARSLSSSFPAWPTNGTPCLSSWKPGASPTNIRSASGLPLPKTTCVRPSCRRQRVQPATWRWNASSSVNCSAAATAAAATTARGSVGRLLGGAVRGRGRGCELPPAGGVLGRIADQVDEHLLDPAAIAEGGRAVRVGSGDEGDRIGQVLAHRLDGLAHELTEVDAVALEPQLVAVEAARDQHVLRDLRQARALGADHLQQLAAALVAELDVVTHQRLGGADYRRHGRAQLVGDGGDELALGLVEPALDGQVAEGVDDPARASDGDEREPELLAVDLDRQRHRPRRRRAERDGDLLLDAPPVRERLGGRTTPY